MAVNDELTLRIVGRYQDQNIVNTLTVRVSAQTTEEKNICAALITAFQSECQVAWLARHLDTYTLVGYKAFRKTGVAKTPHFTSVGSAGVVTGEELPSFVCRTITLYTDSTNHRRRGRVMLSATAVAQLDTADGSLTAGEIVALNVLGAALTGSWDANGDSFQLCIPAGVDKDGNPIPTEDITDFAARETPSSVTTRRIRQFLVG